MKIKTTLNFSIPEVRREFVKSLAVEFNNPFGTFDPYCPNAGNETYWTLDDNNNWKVLFFYHHGENDTFEIRYRYNGEKAEKFMREWVEKNSGEIV